MYISICKCGNSFTNLNLFQKFILRKNKSKSFTIKYKVPAYPSNLISSFLDYYVPVSQTPLMFQRYPSIFYIWDTHLYRTYTFFPKLPLLPIFKE